jgi:putative toxin-antitoxin system antitoxin component (TIGR02293 family)
VEVPVSDVAQGDGFTRAAELLGGDRVLRRRIGSMLDVHELLLKGLPVAALNFLVSNLQSLRDPDRLEKATGMSLRTFQRRREADGKPLSQEQSGRTWKFAEILSRATDVFGSQAAAERWLEQPAMGLDHNRPLDLLATPAGVELVEQFLTRLEYGVYT